MKILLAEDNPGDARLLMEELKGEGSTSAGAEVRWVETLESALQALAGHGSGAVDQPFDAVLLDLNLPDSQGLATFEKVHQRHPEMPVVLLTGLEDESLGLRAVQEGAQDFLVKGQTGGSAITRSLRYAVERNRSLQWHISKSKHTPGGRIVSFFGVKGGVGTTTLALNTAAALAPGRLVVAVELRGDFGSFAAHLRNASRGGLAELMRLDPAAITQEEVELRLSRSHPGFYVLAGPQTVDECCHLVPEKAGRLLDALQGMADCVVLDMPSVWGPAHALVAGRSHQVVLVSEKDHSSMMAVRFARDRIRGAGVAGHALHLAIVHRTPVIESLDLAAFEQAAGLRVVGVVPPSPDICAAAQREGTPLVLFRPRSVPAAALNGIAQALAADPGIAGAEAPAA